MGRKTLHFNSARAIEGFKEKMKSTANDLLNEYYAEIHNQMRTTSGRGGLEKLTEIEENIIKCRVIGNARSIMDSYGTGSAMDKDNPYLDEYMNSELWNDLRSGYAIVGRSQGQYKNIYGATDYSTGSMAGSDVESITGVQQPSYAFQNAETWFFGGSRVNEILSLVIREYFRGIVQYFEYR